MQEDQEWEEKLSQFGLSMHAGTDEHLISYMGGANELEKLAHMDMGKGVDSTPVFEWQVENRLLEARKETRGAATGRMKTLRASRATAKQLLKEKIWGV